MPFTLAHPAAVLPLHRASRGRLPLAALVAGSVAPDFVYFAPFGVDGRYSHGAEGLFLFCVPAGLLAWLLFHVLLRRPLAALLPDRLFQRLPACALDRNAWRSAPPMAVLAALGLGATSHIVWDAFTHRHTVAAYDLSPLQTIVWPGSGFELRLYKLLQHASSAAGIVILAHAVRRWALRAHPLRPPGASMAGRFKLMMTGAAVVAAILRLCETTTAAGAAGVEHLVAKAVVRSIDGISLALLLFCLAWQAVDGLRRFRKRYSGKSA